MSRWSDLPRQVRAAWSAVAGSTLGILAVTGLAGAATADPSPSAPVANITAPVLDIVTSVTDARHTMIVDQSARRVRVTLDATVLFDKDSAAVRPGGAGRIEQAVATIRTRGPGRLRIAGYTDDLGSAEHGLVLSRQRAAAVARIVGEELPVARYPLVVIGKGESDPAVPNTSEQNRRRNRRVVITYEPG
jgi:outer membrane protein OmpA-like peptidoglycan-associated protein